MNEKFNKLMEKLGSDEQLMEKLMEQETPEEAQSILKEAGFEFNIAEIMELREEIIKMAELNQNDELSDQSLDGVAGGVGGNIDPIGIISWRGRRSRGILPVRRVRFRIRVPRRW